MFNYSKNFSENLKRLRRDAGLTQKQLADATGFSEKTVSKWECAESIPDIAALYLIAGFLHTSIDGLFHDNDRTYFLGIDGGGTKTELALADSDGKILRLLHTDSCNPIDIGIEAAKDVLKKAIYQICDGILFSSVVTFAGIAGGTSSDMCERLAEFFNSFGFRLVRNGSDILNIIAAGLGKSDGITLILGTGICVYSQLAGVNRRVSGWGYLIDDGGSAYNIGRDALAAYYSELDKSGPQTSLSREINRMYPKGAQFLLGKVYEGGKKMIASFSPMVFKAAEEGDAIADAILKRNMASAARVIRAASTDFSEDGVIPLVLAGGLTSQPTLLDYLRSALDVPERYDIRVLDSAPVNGAIIRARELFQNKEIG